MTSALLPRSFGRPLCRAVLQGNRNVVAPHHVFATPCWTQIQHLSALVPRTTQATTLSLGASCGPLFSARLRCVSQCQWQPANVVKPDNSGTAFGRRPCLPGHVGSDSSGKWGAFTKPFSLGSLRFITRNLHGRLFYKRRPRMVPRWKFNWRSKWLEGVGCRKGVCTKVMVLAPKKPNSGLRKCAYVRLSNGRVVKVYIPGIGHNLQVHSVVMVRGGRKRDVIGCNYTAMRGHYDLLPVKNRKSSRSKYGVTRPTTEPKRKRFKRLVTAVDRRLHFYRTGDEVGPEDDIEPKIKHIVRNHPPVTYRHHKKSGKK